MYNVNIPLDCAAVSQAGVSVVLLIGQALLIPFGGIHFSVLFSPRVLPPLTEWHPQGQKQRILEILTSKPSPNACPVG